MFSIGCKFSLSLLTLFTVSFHHSQFYETSFLLAKRRSGHFLGFFSEPSSLLDVGFKGLYMAYHRGTHGGREGMEDQATKGIKTYQIRCKQFSKRSVKPANKWDK